MKQCRISNLIPVFKIFLVCSSAAGSNEPAEHFVQVLKNIFLSFLHQEPRRGKEASDNGEQNKAAKHLIKLSPIFNLLK